MLWLILIRFQITQASLYLMMKMDVTQEQRNTPYESFY